MKKILLMLTPFLILLSCSEPAPQVPYNKIEKDNPNASFLELNKAFAEIEDSLICVYVKNSPETFATTKSGLRYYIKEQGVGNVVGHSDDVTFRYSVRQLDGTTCDKLTNVTKTVSLEKGELERGFREALSMLRVSGTGVFVMPSFLAYGVVGVSQCIPAWTPVECEITLVDFESK